MSELRKNERYVCEVEGWSSDGAGVARIGGQTVFIPGAIPGERWEVRVVKALTDYAYGKGERCLWPSP